MLCSLSNSGVNSLSFGEDDLNSRLLMIFKTLNRSYTEVEASESFDLIDVSS